MFPSVQGSSLSGTTHLLPDTLAGDVNLLLVAFRQWQQAAVDTWLEVAGGLKREYPQLHVYELPVISSWYRPVARYIDGGMRAGIADPQVRESTITLYINRADFLRDLNIQSVHTIVPMLVTPNGQVLWRATGARSEKAEAALRKTLAAMESRA